MTRLARIRWKEAATQGDRSAAGRLIAARGGIVVAVVPPRVDDPRQALSAAVWSIRWPS
jgi:hypothetical protein